MKFAVDDKTYEFDFDTISFDEGEIIEDYVRMDIPEFAAAVRVLKMRALRAVVYIGKLRAGEDVTWAELGSLDVAAIAKSIVDLNPTAPAGSGNGKEAAEESPAAVKLRKASKRRAKPAPKPALQPAPEPAPEPAAG